MKKCPYHREDLWLFLYGEAPSAVRSQWEQHLVNCASCRNETDRLYRMIETLQISSPSPPSDGEKGVIRRLHHGPLSGKRSAMGEPVPPGGGPTLLLRPFPSIILAACLVVTIAAGMYIQGFGRSGLPDPGVDPSSETAMLDEEAAEVIGHLDLLQELETIRKLVQVVDGSSVDSSPPGTPTDRSPSDSIRSHADDEVFS